MAKAVKLSNGREFSSQKAATVHFRAILHAYADGDEIIDATHHSDLVALLERYDAAITDTPSKIGTGIVRFERRLNVGAGFATPGFWVERADGSWTDFSFPTAISAKPKPQSQEFADACRGVVASDLRAAKLRHFKAHGDEQGRVPCDITGQLITIDEAHLDHAHWPFGTLIAMFREARGWHEVIPAGVLTVPQHQQTTTTFADPAIASAFKAFHHRTATLRIISAKVNLSMASQQRKPKIKLPVKLEPEAASRPSPSKTKGGGVQLCRLRRFGRADGLEPGRILWFYWHPTAIFEPWKKRAFPGQYAHPLKQVRSRALENIGPKRAYVPQHRRCAVERLLPITLEMLGIFCAKPKE